VRPQSHSHPTPVACASAFIVLSSTRSEHYLVTTTDPRHHPVRHRVRLAGLRRRRRWELHPGVRSDTELSVGERAADAARDALGSWPFLAVAVALVGVGIGTAIANDGRAGPAATLGLVLGGLGVVELLLVLMAVGRADRTTAELALHDLESIRRAAAGIHEVRDEVGQLREDIAQLVARLDAQRMVHRETP
jgi:uncharacterized membrane protein